MTGTGRGPLKRNGHVVLGGPRTSDARCQCGHLESQHDSGGCEFMACWCLACVIVEDNEEEQ